MTALHRTRKKHFFDSAFVAIQALHYNSQFLTENKLRDRPLFRWLKPFLWSIDSIEERLQAPGSRGWVRNLAGWLGQVSLWRSKASRTPNEFFARQQKRKDFQRRADEGECSQQHANLTSCEGSDTSRDRKELPMRQSISENRDGFHVRKSEFTLPAETWKLDHQTKRAVTICNLFVNYQYSIPDIVRVLDEDRGRIVRELIKQGIIRDRRVNQMTLPHGTERRKSVTKSAELQRRPLKTS